MSLSSIFFLGDNTDSACLLRVWLFNLSFTWTIGPLFVKVGRVWRVFENQSHRKVKYSEFDAVKNMVKLLLVDVAVLVAWTLADPPAAEDPNPSDNDIQTVCVNSVGFTSVLLVYKAAIVAGACYMSYVTRSIAEYSDGKSIMAAI